MTDELGGKVMTKFVQLRAKTYSYLIDGGNEDKKAKCTKIVQKQLNVRMTYVIQKKIRLSQQIV